MSESKMLGSRMAGGTGQREGEGHGSRVPELGWWWREAVPMGQQGRPQSSASRGPDRQPQAWAGRIKPAA